MALPKRRTSKSRRDKRRTHWVLTTPAVGRCSRCGSPKRPHTVCPSCGYYKGRRVVEVEEL